MIGTIKRTAKNPRPKVKVPTIATGIKAIIPKMNRREQAPTHLKPSFLETLNIVPNFVFLFNDS